MYKKTPFDKLYKINLFLAVSECDGTGTELFLNRDKEAFVLLLIYLFAKIQLILFNTIT